MTVRPRPEVVRLAGDSSDEERLCRAARAIACGRLVAFPTDTVYGLGADSSRKEAVERLYEVKRRDRAKPFAVLVPSARAAREAAPVWPPLARKLARVHWPGALTIVAGGRGFRVPDHAGARALASRTAGGLAATSANRSGGSEPRSAEEVVEALGADVDLVLDGGRTAGTPSSVVRVEGESLEVLREGRLSAEELRDLARPRVLFVCRGNTCRSPTAAAAFAREIRGRGRPEVEALSGGLDVAGGDAGQGASGEAAGVAAQVGLDLSGHAVRAVTPELLARADRVFVMERSQLETIVSLLPEEADHVELLDPRARDIEDPAGGGPAAQRRARDEILAAVRVRSVRLLEELGPAGREDSA
jgi:tRNA threonylcarbamoyl adenosine modification protein (Sua5/YciO/YrdC/YwlC family)